MARDSLQYDKMVENALRGVVREALDTVREDGLPGSHHFYLTFRTNHPGVEIAERLHAQYPREMTIVLQHQYWGLEVTDEYFIVNLSFSNVPERLKVPYAAMVSFVDPSVKFGLQFQAPIDIGGRNATDEGKAGGAEGAKDTPPLSLASGPGSNEAAKSKDAPAPRAAKETADKSGSAASPGDQSAEGGDKKPAEKVISLDAFRKK